MPVVLIFEDMAPKWTREAEIKEETVEEVWKRKKQHARVSPFLTGPPYLCIRILVSHVAVTMHKAVATTPPLTLLTCHIGSNGSLTNYISQTKGFACQFCLPLPGDDQG